MSFRHQGKVEEEFAAEVWHHAGRKVTESVVGFLGFSVEINPGAFWFFSGPSGGRGSV